MEITKDQYDKLKEFGAHPENHGFDKTYDGLQHNCVYFTWKALDFAEIEHDKSTREYDEVTEQVREYNGRPKKPVDNINDVKRIQAPFPDSPLNQEHTQHTHPMPANRTLMQHLLSENNLAPEVRDALPAHLSSEQKINIATVVNTEPDTYKNYKVFDCYVDGNELGVCYQNKNNWEAYIERIFDLNQVANTPAQQTLQAHEQTIAQNQAMAQEQVQTQSPHRSMSIS